MRRTTRNITQAVVCLIFLALVGFLALEARGDDGRSALTLRLTESPSRSSGQPTGIPAALLKEVPDKVFSGARRKDVVAVQVWLDQARLSPGPSTAAPATTLLKP